MFIFKKNSKSFYLNQSKRNFSVTITKELTVDSKYRLGVNLENLLLRKNKNENENEKRLKKNIDLNQYFYNNIVLKTNLITAKI